MSAPAFQAAMISVGVSAPGKTATPAARQEATVSSVQARADDEARAGGDAGPRRLGVEHRARADHHLVPEALAELLDHLQRAGHRQRDLEVGDGRRDQRLGHGQRVLGGGGAHDRDQHPRPDAGQRFCFVALASFFHDRKPQRETRAPPPFITFRTSSRVAMLVSPGVVMARAPWAAPQSTANCGPRPDRKP